MSHISKKLGRDPVLESRYNSAIKDMWNSGIIEEVPREESVGCGPVFYMPHRPVIRESSVSTKVRPVFDASAKGFNGLSLNDCMEVGPCLLSNLTEILLRFRRWQIAVTSDIEKAFLQIGVKKDDCDVHRFLWDVNGSTKVMRFARVPFGNCSSPFLLNATVQFHLSGFPESRVVEELKENMYVDDFCPVLTPLKNVVLWWRMQSGSCPRPACLWWNGGPTVQRLLRYCIGTSGTSISTVSLSRFWACYGLRLMIVSPSGVLSWPRICVLPRGLSWVSSQSSLTRWDLLPHTCCRLNAYFRSCGLWTLDGMMRSLLNIRFVSCAGWMGLMCWNRGESQGGTRLVARMPFAACSFMHFQMHPPRLMELVCICELSSVITRLCHLWSWLNLRWHLWSKRHCLV